MFYQYHMSSSRTSLNTLDNGRYPAVKPVTVETFLKKYGKDVVGQSNKFEVSRTTPVTLGALTFSR